MRRATAPATSSVQKALLLVGGGHAHVAVVRRFGQRPVPGVHVTLLSRDVHTPYSGMLPGLVAGHYTHADCHIDLARLCASNGVRLIQGDLLSLDLGAQTAQIAGRGPLGWDLLSLNTGSRPALGTIPGAVEHGVAVKPIDRFLAVWQAAEDAVVDGRGPKNIAVVGGGAAAVEIALAIAWRLARRGVPDGRCTISVVCAAKQLLETHNRRVRHAMERHLGARGIRIFCRARVAAAHDGFLALADGRQLPCDLPVWAIHAGAPAWPQAAGLACDTAGFVRVDATLRSVSHPAVFAAGDIAAFPGGLPKSGVYAVREGEILADNLARACRAEPLRDYRPQGRFLSLLATGGRHAVASRGAFFAGGEWVWRWKDRIDRRFMQMYRPEPLPPAALADNGMRCGGCAAKVDATTLRGVLARVSPGTDQSLLHGIGSAEDGAVIAPPTGQVLVQSVDYFRAFTDDPWLLGRIGAVHALGDIHAMGARPHSALAIATVAHAAPHVMREALAQMMAGAEQTLQEESVILTGGHSNEGTEPGFGLSVNGFSAPADLLLKSGLCDGLALVLTKPLGTGVLFAANMAGAADGEWIGHALATMQQGHAGAMRILRHHGVRACTDVTGFGLLGHLGEMLRASAIGAEVFAASIPALPGARECLAAGYRSSLHSSNAEALSSLDGTPARETVLEALLVDPQTAGGLLAAVPQPSADACVEALRDAGYAAVMIGRAEGRIPAGRVRLC